MKRTVGITNRFYPVTRVVKTLPVVFIPCEFDSVDALSRYLSGGEYHAVQYPSQVNNIRRLYTQFFIHTALRDQRAKGRMVDINEVNFILLHYDPITLFDYYFGYMQHWYWSTHEKFIMWYSEPVEVIINA